MCRLFVLVERVDLGTVRALPGSTRALIGAQSRPYWSSWCPELTALGHHRQGGFAKGAEALTRLDLHLVSGDCRESC
jgi:hypothetical protein